MITFIVDSSRAVREEMVSIDKTVSHVQFKVNASLSAQLRSNEFPCKQDARLLIPDFLI